MESLADLRSSEAPPEVANPVNTSAFLVTYLVRLPTTGLVARNNFRLARHSRVVWDRAIARRVDHLV